MGGSAKPTPPPLALRRPFHMRPRLREAERPQSMHRPRAVPKYPASTLLLRQESSSPTTCATDQILITSTYITTITRRLPFSTFTFERAITDSQSDRTTTIRQTVVEAAERSTTQELPVTTTICASRPSSSDIHPISTIAPDETSPLHRSSTLVTSTASSIAIPYPSSVPDPAAPTLLPPQNKTPTIVAAATVPLLVFILVMCLFSYFRGRQQRAESLEMGKMTAPMQSVTTQEEVQYQGRSISNRAIATAQYTGKQPRSQPMMDLGTMFASQGSQATTAVGEFIPEDSISFVQRTNPPERVDHSFESTVVTSASYNQGHTVQNDPRPNQQLTSSNHRRPEALRAQATLEAMQYHLPVLQAPQPSQRAAEADGTPDDEGELSVEEVEERRAQAYRALHGIAPGRVEPPPRYPTNTPDREARQEFEREAIRTMRALRRAALGHTTAEGEQPRTPPRARPLDGPSASENERNIAAQNEARAREAARQRIQDLAEHTRRQVAQQHERLRIRGEGVVDTTQTDFDVDAINRQNADAPPRPRAPSANTRRHGENMPDAMPVAPPRVYPPPINTGRFENQGGMGRPVLAARAAPERYHARGRGYSGHTRRASITAGGNLGNVGGQTGQGSGAEGFTSQIPAPVRPPPVARPRPSSGGVRQGRDEEA